MTANLTIGEQLLHIVSTQFGIPRDQITWEATLQELEIDSLGGVELLLALKKHVGVDFQPGEITTEHTVAQISAMVTERLESRSA